MITETYVSNNYYNFAVTIKEDKTYHYVWFNDALYYPCTTGIQLANSLATLKQVRQVILRDLQKRHLTAHIALTDLQDTINTLTQMTVVQPPS